MTATRKCQSRGEHTPPSSSVSAHTGYNYSCARQPTAHLGSLPFPGLGAAPKIPVLTDCTELVATIAWSCFLFILEHFSKCWLNFSPSKGWNVFLVEQHTAHFCLNLILFSMTTWWWLNTPKVTSLEGDARETEKVVLVKRIPGRFSFQCCLLFRVTSVWCLFLFWGGVWILFSRFQLWERNFLPHNSTQARPSTLPLEVKFT